MIQFRKIHGRIVPIRDKSAEKKHEAVNQVVKGAAIVAAGVGVAFVAGKVAAFAVKQSAQFANTARDFAKAARASRTAMDAKDAGQMAFKFVDHGAAFKTAGRNALRSQVISEALYRNRKLVKGAGIALGAGIIGQGVKTSYEAATGKKLGTKGQIAASAAGTVAALGTGAAYFKSLGSSSYSAAFREALTKVIRKGK